MKQLLLALLLPGSLLAQGTFSLKEAQAYALENNPQMKIARFDIAQSQEQVKEVRAIGLPQVNAEGTFNHYPNLPVNLIPAQFFNPMAAEDDFIAVRFGTDYNVTGSLTATQLLFDGSYLVGLQAAKMYPEMSEKNLERISVDIKANVEQAYFMALVADAQILILENMNKANRQLLEQARAVLEVGVSDSTLYDQMKLAVLRVETEERRAQRNKELARKSLKMHMGMDLNAEITLSDNLSSVIDAIGFDQLNDQFDTKTHVNYQILETQMTLQELNLKNKKANYLPSLGAFFTQQYQAQRNEFNFLADEKWYPMTIWGLKLSVPIFSSGQRRAQTAQAEIEVEKIKAQMEQVNQGLALEYESAKAEFTSSYEVYQATTKSLEIAQRMNNRVKTKYSAKTVNVLELTQSELQLLETLGSYVQSMYELLNAKVKLDKITNTFDNE